MSDKITVLCVKKTGHVLAALTRAADPESEITVEELAGEEGLLVRGLAVPPDPNALFFVPAAELKAAVVDSKPGVIESPRRFYLDENDEVQPLDAARAVSSVAVSAAPVKVTVNVNAAAQADKAAVWVYVPEQDPSQSQTLTGEKPENALSVALDAAPLGPGAPHYFLVLVEGALPNSFHVP